MSFVIFPDSSTFWFPDILKMTFKTLKIMADFVPIENASKEGDHLESVKQRDLCSFTPCAENIHEMKFRCPSEGLQD